MEGRPWVKRITFCLALLFVCGSVAEAADVAPRDVVDGTSWEKARELLPEPMLSWVKKGDFVLDIGQLKYDPNHYWPEAAARSFELNKGKYGLDEKGLIVDAATGETPEHIEGIPFPEIDLNEPRAGYRVMYNRMSYGYTMGNLHFPMRALWVGRSGYEREVEAAFWVYPMIGHSQAGQEDNSDRVEKFSIVQVVAPYDIAGTNVLTWRYLDDRQDMTYTFVPAIRRVRRMSPANRSDAYLGTDMCVDDAAGYDGKISAVDWMPVKKREALVPFLDENPQPLVQNKKGEWMSAPTIKEITYGYEAKDWKGAPWAPTNLAWVKRDVLLLEFKPRDPYYNYGRQTLWVDAEVPYLVYYKVITDRADVYWKAIVLSWTAAESTDKKIRYFLSPMMVTVDDRADHGTILSCVTPDLINICYAIQDRNTYSLAGFQKLCK
ncbi:MAG: DUF1329 domain-containing protein [bacterium]